MTTLNPELVDHSPGQWDRYKWLGIVTDDTIVDVQIDALAAELNFHIFGTFANGTSVAINGSNDGGTTFTALTDGTGSVVAKTAAGMVSVREQPLKVKPVVTDGSSDSIDVWLVIRYPK